MTYFAGVYCLSGDATLDKELCQQLTSSISRWKDDDVLTIEREGCYIAKVDIGAYVPSGILADKNGAVSVLTGEPLLELDGGEHAVSREQELAMLHTAFGSSDWSVLRRTRGTFSAAYYDPSRRCLYLAADKLGIRPLHFWSDGKVVVFASTLRILESLPQLGLTMDLRGVTELAAFGFPLADRTPYLNTRRLRGGEIIHFYQANISRQVYWRWDRVAPITEPESVWTKLLYDRFMEAVDLRLRGDRCAQAFLSGGLDSRCIATALVHRDVQLHTYNFSYDGSLDQILGAEYARQLGTVHHEARLRPLETGDAWPQYIANTLREIEYAPGERPQRTQVTWSGDGGSVCAGHVYLNEEMIAHLRANHIDAAIDAYLKANPRAVPKKLLRRPFAKALAALPRRGIKEELMSLQCSDPGRKLYVFLLMNDQARHLSRYFENLDITRVEYVLPFYDSNFVELFSAIPIDHCLRHKLYVRWLHEFPSVITSVAWQAYPGHVPCPIPMPEEGWAQWDSDTEPRQARKRELLKQVNSILGAKPFPDPIVSRARLRLSKWITHLGLGDYGYVFRVASVYKRYWVQCCGRYALPEVSKDM